MQTARCLPSCDQAYMTPQFDKGHFQLIHELSVCEIKYCFHNRLLRPLPTCLLVSHVSESCLPVRIVHREWTSLHAHASLLSEINNNCECGKVPSIFDHWVTRIRRSVCKPTMLCLSQSLPRWTSLLLHQTCCFRHAVSLFPLCGISCTPTTSTSSR